MLLSELIDTLHEMYQQDGDMFVYAESDDAPVVDAQLVFFGEEDEYDEDDGQLSVLLITGTIDDPSELN